MTEERELLALLYALYGVMGTIVFMLAERIDRKRNSNHGITAIMLNILIGIFWVVLAIPVFLLHKFKMEK